MKHTFELLAPGGDIKAIKAAIIAGADAVYCGVNKFNARNRADNISINDLQRILYLAHTKQCKVFLTLNIILLDSEIPEMIKLLNGLVNTTIDGIIVQDIGLFYLVKKYFKSLKVHASTQTTTHNVGQIAFLQKLNVERVNLSRELNVEEIKQLTTFAHKQNLLTEVFVHGSNCLSFSGLCYMSSVQSGNSGNRGRCSQPCRDQFDTTPVGAKFPLNLKDNTAFLDIHTLYNMRVDSLKIEGRIKRFDYVYTVVNAWRKQINAVENGQAINSSKKVLYSVFNRGFSSDFLNAKIESNTFADHPRDHSVHYLKGFDSPKEGIGEKQFELDLFKRKENNRKIIENKINAFNDEKPIAHLIVSGKKKEPLQVKVELPSEKMNFCTETNLSDKGTEALTYALLYKRLKVINDTEYSIGTLDLSSLSEQVYLPFRVLTKLKNSILYALNGEKKWNEPIILPKLKPNRTHIEKPTLSIKISSEKDLQFCLNTKASLFFELPNDLSSNLDYYIILFRNNKALIPWFPSILIANQFDAAVNLIKKVKPSLLVANNSGIAFEASSVGIKWIAGPSLNLSNSYSLIALKESFNCSGAFLSSELSKQQIKSIKKPKDFNLYYSMYNPIELMTSRACLFLTTVGCNKTQMDEACLSNCKKQATIIKTESTYYIEKSLACFNKLYSNNNFLNCDVVQDFPNLFASYTLDFREIETSTTLKLEKEQVVQLFQRLIDGDKTVGAEIQQCILNTNNSAYSKGI